MTRVLLPIVLLLVLAAPQTASAQIGVIDPANLVQNIATVRHMLSLYAQAMRQYDLWQAVTRPLRHMREYGPRALPQARELLDVLSDRRYGPWSTRPVPREDESPMMRRALRGLTLSDEVSSRALEHTAIVRYGRVDIARAIGALERDVVDLRDPAHSMGANMDKLSGAALIAARQQEATHALLEVQIEQQLEERASRREAAMLAYEMGSGFNTALAANLDSPREWWTGR